MSHLSTFSKFVFVLLLLSPSFASAENCEPETTDKARCRGETCSSSQLGSSRMDKDQESIIVCLKDKTKGHIWKGQNSSGTSCDVSIQNCKGTAVCAEQKTVMVIVTGSLRMPKKYCARYAWSTPRCTTNNYKLEDREITTAACAGTNVSGYQLIQCVNGTPKTVSGSCSADALPTVTVPSSGTHEGGRTTGGER